MRFPSRAEVERLRRRYPAGTKVRLISMEDPQSPPPGTIGKILYIDDAGSAIMRWANGSGLNLILGVDSFEIVEEPV